MLPGVYGSARPCSHPVWRPLLSAKPQAPQPAARSPLPTFSDMRYILTWAIALLFLAAAAGRYALKKGIKDQGIRV